MYYFYIILALIMNLNCYKIQTVSELKHILHNESRDILRFDLQLKDNLAFIYYLKTGHVIMLPNNLLDNEKGILFDSKSCFEKYLQKDSFPIENQEIQIEENFQEEILEVNLRIDSIVAYFVKKYDHESQLTLSDILLKVRNDEKQKRVDSKETLYSGLLLGEFVRRAVDGKWILLKKYGTFNPYYTPGIIYPDGSILILREKLDLFFESDSILPEGFLKWPGIRNPSLKFESRVFKSRYPYYQIF